jgi:putative two-component system response regulator
MTEEVEAIDDAILVIDDEPANVRLIERLLAREGYTRVVGTTDSALAVDVFRAFPPDLVLLDLRMPPPDGYAVLELLGQELAEGEILPIMVLTAETDAESKKRALGAGAADFVSKPFAPFEMLLRMKNLLRTRRLYLELQRRNRYLEDRVLERTTELARAQAEMLERLAQAVEARDGETGEHTRRVGENSALLARALALPAERIELIRRAAPLHDVGKIGIPDTILLKPGPLTGEELEIVRTHTTIGAKILSRGESPLVQTAERIALSHHERWDGAGYPNRLQGEEIPLEGRIVAVADVFDALMHDRPYRYAWGVERVRDEIAREMGRHFDPVVATAFLELHASGSLME